MDIYTIYKFTNRFNNKIYIGKTKGNPLGRKNKHKKIAEENGGFYFHNAINKYGFDNFDYEIIFQSSSNLIKEQEFTDTFEPIFIVEYESHFTQHGYNLTWGGGGFDPESQKYYAKLRTEQGKNPFSGGKIQKETNRKRIEEGTHHLLGPDANLKMLENGSHPSQKEGFSERVSELQNKKVKDGTHYFLNKPKVTCLYCRKTMDIGNFTQSHGKNCKLFVQDIT